MHRLLLLGAILLGLAAPAAAAARTPVTVIRTTTITDPRPHHKAEAAQSAACPAGVPTQTITVVNQANVRPWALAKVENAVTDQSMQLRAAWGTPCAQFGAGGWNLYLKGGGAEPHGEHDFYGQPYALVWTSGARVEGWSRDFSHELIEMLIDPLSEQDVYRDGVSEQFEIADPVQWHGYELDGVYVSDFVLPNWFAGATEGAPVCVGSTCTFPGPELAAGDAAGPYDHMGLLSAPWETAAAPS